MPELPEVERLRRSLAPAMVGARFDRVVLNRGDLRKPFPPGFARQLRRQIVRSLSRRGKYLLAELASGETLLMHLGMSGWFRVETTRSLKKRRYVGPTFRSGARRLQPEIDLENRHDHVIFTMSSGMTVTFNDPRRFGLMDLIPNDQSPHVGLERLGPEPLSRAFNSRTFASRCVNRRISLKVALLDQLIVAGIGNIYASEALHLARLSPLRLAATIATSGGRPRAGCVRLVAAIKAVLRRAIAIKESGVDDEPRFRVYDREGGRCPTPGCHGTVARAWQAGRSTFYCPTCQK